MFQDDYDAEFKLIDVVDDDDEVVLDSGWLDKIFDNDPPRSSHVTCGGGDDDVIGSQHVSDEHSYSLSNGTSDLDYTIKMESNEMGWYFLVFHSVKLFVITDVSSTESMLSDQIQNHRFTPFPMFLLSSSSADRMNNNNVVLLQRL